MIEEYPKSTIATSAIIIIISWGSVIASYVNPNDTLPQTILSTNQQGEVEAAIDKSCPQLRPIYDINLEPDRTVRIDIAAVLLRKCVQIVNTALTSDKLYNALVKEFERNRHGY